MTSFVICASVGPGSSAVAASCKISESYRQNDSITQATRLQCAIPPRPARSRSGSRVSDRSGPRLDKPDGQKYIFPMAELVCPFPERSVVVRPEAVIDTRRIRVVEDAASKEQIAIGGSGTRLRNRLVIRARLDKPAASTLRAPGLTSTSSTQPGISSHRHDLASSRPSRRRRTRSCASGTPRCMGSGGASGMGVWNAADTHTIQYRLYCQIERDVFTDGVLHQFDVAADAEVKPIPGGW